MHAMVYAGRVQRNTADGYATNPADRKNPVVVITRAAGRPGGLDEDRLF